MLCVLQKKQILPKIRVPVETEKLMQMLLCKTIWHCFVDIFFFFFGWLVSFLAFDLFFFFLIRSWLFFIHGLELGSYFQWEIFAFCCFECYLLALQVTHSLLIAGCKS